MRARANLEQQKEDSLEHPAIRPAVYYNYALKGVETPVVFGADLGLTGKRLETLVEFLIEQMPASHSTCAQCVLQFGVQAGDLFLQVKWKEAFEMEKESKGFATLMRKQVWAPADLAMLLTVRRIFCYKKSLTRLSMSFCNTPRCSLSVQAKPTASGNVRRHEN